MRRDDGVYIHASAIDCESAHSCDLPSPEIAADIMPTITADREEYIGYIEMPTINIDLPVLSGWSYTKLRRAPLPV